MDSKSSDSEEKVKEDEECDNENDILKKKISSHPLYRLLVESHVDCLKVGAIDELEIMNERKHLKQQENGTSLGTLKHSELDHFMKAYCFALGKLKEAIEEPQQKSMAFIKSMHSQLTELKRSSTHPDESANSDLLVSLQNDRTYLLLVLDKPKKKKTN
ncbi:Homeobox protein knotted-1-like 1 [Morus notabilis]|uniref:Homeobox protein knotted-1-like 1 n=1 Tax=Morus notabilis TaxID=981085 RepID=W9QPA9_9ROSA|nr:Homeobox protein knotted-1-like 1 [Morus notabilis]